MNQECQIGEEVYGGTLSSDQPNYKKKKIVIAEESFKGCLYNDNLSFRSEFYKKKTQTLGNQDEELHQK